VRVRRTARHPFCNYRLPKFIWTKRSPVFSDPCPAPLHPIAIGRNRLFLLADSRIDLHHDQLATLDKLRIIRGFVDLHGKDEASLTEDVVRVVQPALWKAGRRAVTAPR
jgi:hypothetical protein